MTIETNLTLDGVSLTKQVIEEILSDIDRAYPNRYINEDDAHRSLQKIKARVITLKSVINNLKPKE
jgi:hypothetical protein